MERSERDFKDVWIPREIWLSTELSLMEKVLFVKIHSLDNERGCFASSVLVIPENAQGNYDVIVESSTDLVTWAPFFSQTVTSGGNSRFYRTPIVKK